MNGIRIKTKHFSADDINSLKSGVFESTNNMSKFGMYGMVAGVGYSLLRKKSVMWGILIGSLSGVGIGVMLDKAKKKI